MPSTQTAVVAEILVLETSGFLDLILGTPEGQAVRDALVGRQVHVVDNEAVGIAIALRELRRIGSLSEVALTRKLGLVADAPFRAHSVRELLVASAARDDLRLGDALCVELSHRLAAPLVTTDSRLAAVWSHSWLVTAASNR
ncbi:MAG: VapC toxin family PIN domain ribonuclease [Candidatus Dormiibacterota bacterium]